MLTSLDANVGKVLQVIADLGLTGDTIVIFTSDNGGERYSNVWPLTRHEDANCSKGHSRAGAGALAGPYQAGHGLRPGRHLDGLDADLHRGRGCAQSFDAPTDGMSILPQLTGTGPSRQPQALLGV